MDELSRRLRASGPNGHAPLPDRAQATLENILVGDGAPSVRTPVPSRRGTKRGPVLIFGAGLAVTATVLALVLVSFLRPATALAVTPNALTLHSTSWTIESLRKQLEADSAGSMDSGNPEIRANESSRGATGDGWYIQLDPDQPLSTYIQPQHIQLKWNPDFSGSSQITAGAPQSAHGKPLDSIPEGAAQPGTILSSDSWSAGEFDPQFKNEPPLSVDAMRSYLAEYLGGPSSDGGVAWSAGAYTYAVESLMQVWTLCVDAERAAIQVILSAPDVEVEGKTTDRFGREGVALAMQDSNFFPERRVQLIVDPANWKILAIEYSTSAGLPEFNIPAGAVIEYSIWR